jgi:hypothetical protein
MFLQSNITHLIGRKVALKETITMMISINKMKHFIRLIKDVRSVAV